MAPNPATGWVFSSRSLKWYSPSLFMSSSSSTLIRSLMLDIGCVFEECLILSYFFICSASSRFSETLDFILETSFCTTFGFCTFFEGFWLGSGS